ncbi:MAG: 2-C-methyl-D-erythritol 2,4-cyclodiphosphate synthase [Syntrophomonadaceae bacterium]
MRVGIGYDVHRFQEGRRLVIGGVEIPYHKGLLGHSDADVLIHAICDALLGAAGLGDIGQYFPDSDERYKDIDSLILLEQTAGLLEDRGWLVGNIDSTVVAQKPRLAPYIGAMKEKITGVLNIPAENVGIKATTSEGLGFEGREEGISAQAVVLLKTRLK